MINPLPGMYRPPRPDYDYFHARLRPHHAGVDLYAVRDTEILAATPGTVHAGGFLNQGAGWGVELWYPTGSGGILTRYLHMPTNGPKVFVGDTVEEGQVIGAVGCTGICNSPHLHFETRQVNDYDPGVAGVQLGTPLDPLSFGILVPGEGVPVEVTVLRPVLRRESPPYTAKMPVKELQYLLSLRGFLDMTPGVNYNITNGQYDGKFGPSTETGVKRFQEFKGQNVDGVVGEATWKVLLDY